MKILCSKYDVPHSIVTFFRSLSLDVSLAIVNRHSDLLECTYPDFVYFGGGNDVTPELYGKIPDVNTNNNVHRDLLEMLIFKHFRYFTDTKYVGICRGSQFLNVMCGGTLFQHLVYEKSQHSAIHEVVVDGTIGFRDYVNVDKFTVNSTHHQASNQLGENLLCTLFDDRYGIIEGFASRDGDKIRAVQSHPEYFDERYPQSENVLRYLFRL